MPHFLLSKYEISQVSVGGKGSAIEIYWKNQKVWKIHLMGTSNYNQSRDREMDPLEGP